MRAVAEIADAYELVTSVLSGDLDMGDISEEVGAALAFTADALGWALDREDETVLGTNLTNLRLRLFTQHHP